MPLVPALASIVERIAGVSVGELDEARALAQVGERLAAVNLGVLRVTDPAAFAWPGHWIAIIETSAGERVPVAMFGVPSGPLDDADAAILATGRIVEGLVIVPLDLDRPHGAGAYGSAATASGVVTALFTAPAAASACVSHPSCRAIAGQGLEGDRYASGDGTFSAPDRNGQALTLISEEALAQAQANGAEIDAATARRNVVTRGIELEPLIGHRFAIGDVAFRATRLAEPCAHLQRVTRPGVLRGMVHLGGIRADILTDGELRVGDAIRLLPDPA